MVSPPRSVPMSQPPGRYALPEDFIDAFRRDRLAQVLAEIAQKEGLDGLSVGLITSRARMARSTFYGLFENRGAAIAYGTELADRRLRSAIDDAVAFTNPPWQNRLRAAIDALLAYAAEEPGLAALSLVHTAGAADGRLPFDPNLVQTLAGILRPIRRSIPKPGPGPRTEELLAYSILAVLAERLRRGDLGHRSELGAELASLVVTLFSDPEAEGVSV
jgi:AcrR family transcriptional regulator